MKKARFQANFKYKMAFPRGFEPCSQVSKTQYGHVHKWENNFRIAEINLFLFGLASAQTDSADIAAGLFAGSWDSSPSVADLNNSSLYFPPARVAQLAEQPHCRRHVAGSIPAPGSIYFPPLGSINEQAAR